MQYSKTKCAVRISIFLLICFVGMLLVSAPFIFYVINHGESDAAKLMPNAMILAYSSFLLLALFVENRMEKLDLWAFGKSALQTKPAIFAAALGVVWQLSIMLLIWLSNLPYPHSSSVDIPTLLLAVVGMGLVGPVAEELLFREWLIEMMKRGGFKPIAMIVCSAVLFFLCHSMDTPLRIDCLLFAIPLAYIYIKYRDIRYCIIAHVVCNLSSVILPYMV